MLKDTNPLVRNALDLSNASEGEIKKSRYFQLIKWFGRHENDCGSESVKAAILCERVITIMNMLRKNPTNTSGIV